MKTLSIGEVLKFGYATFKKNWLFLAGIFLFSTLTYFILSAIASKLYSANPVLGILLMITYSLLNLLFQIGYVKIGLKFTNGETPQFKDLFTGWRQFIPYLIGCLMYGLMLFVGLILLVFPAFIWGARYGLYPYFIIDKGQGPLEAFASSNKATYGAKWDYFGFFLVGLLLTVAGGAALLLGMFVVFPIVIVAHALVYRKLVAQTPIS